MEKLREALDRRMSAALSTTCGHIAAEHAWVSDRPDTLLCPVCVSAWRDTPIARRADRAPRECAGCETTTDDPALVEVAVGEDLVILAWLCPTCLRET